MLKPSVALFLSVAATAASAAWTKASVNPAGTTYIDTTTILRAGDKVKVWELVDYPAIPNKEFPYLSTKKQTEYDCKERKYRLISVSSHSGQMAKFLTLL